MRQLEKTPADLIEAYMDFLEKLSDELGRNLSYEFNEYFKKRLQSPTEEREGRPG